MDYTLTITKRKFFSWLNQLQITQVDDLKMVHGWKRFLKNVIYVYIGAFWFKRLKNAI